MTHLSLRKRAQLVKERFELTKFTHETLRHYYHKYGVKFKRPDYKYWKSIAENNELQKKQMGFAQELGSIILNRAYDEIIYIDETTFHLWHKLKRCWIT